MIRRKLILGTAILALLCSPAFAGKKKVYITGGGDETIVIEKKDKIITILPKDGGEFKLPDKYKLPPDRFALPDKYKAPEGYQLPEYFTVPEKYKKIPPKYKRPYYNE